MHRTRPVRTRQYPGRHNTGKTFSSSILGFFQDFAAPFILFIKSEYSLHYLGMNDELMQTGIRLRSVSRASVFGREVKRMQCEMFIGPQGLEQFVIQEGKRTTEIKVLTNR